MGPGGSGSLESVDSPPPPFLFFLGFSESESSSSLPFPRFFLALAFFFYTSAALLPDYLIIFCSVVDPDSHGSVTFAALDPALLFRIRIQLNMKEHINKNVISL